MEALLEVKLNIEPVTWGTNDAQKREKLREAIRREVPQFDERYVERLVGGCEELSLILNCYLIDPWAKDIDNLAKIPLDAIFFSGQNERGYMRKWESKITSLKITKIQSSENALQIIIYQSNG